MDDGTHDLKRTTTFERAEDDYFTVNPPPTSLQEYRKAFTDFIAYHAAVSHPVVLVTSGGTTVPLENQTVRFIDNFSAGTRGATSAEYFLEAGYAVVFLHRQFSLLPYSRHYSHSTNCFLDFMTEGDHGEIVINKEYRELMTSVLRKYSAAKNNKMLLVLSFTTVNDYLWMLREFATLMRPLGPSAIFYLAAAVSDFFIPKDRLAEHKIQSSNNSCNTESGTIGSYLSGKKLVIDLDPVPKFLKRLVNGWAPEATIVSFKLETDPALLISKARTALDRYSHHLVIGNLLSTRKWEVVFVPPGGLEKWIRIPLGQRTKSISGPSNTAFCPVALAGSNVGGEQQEAMTPVEIESIIVPEVIKLHKERIKAISTATRN